MPPAKPNYDQTREYAKMLMADEYDRHYTHTRERHQRRPTLVDLTWQGLPAEMRASYMSTARTLLAWREP